MRILIIMLTCIFLTISAKAQFIYDEEGNIVPFSMSTKYKNVIDSSKVNSCLLKSYDNDSLCMAHHKKIESNSSIMPAGFSIDTLIDLRDKATRYQIEEGTVWIYKIESKTAEMLDFRINQLIIPEGAYICVFSKKEESTKKGPRTFLKKDIINPNFHQHQYGNQLFIEYFEPNDVKTKSDIFISKIYYIFRSPLKNTREKKATRTIHDSCSVPAD